MKHTPGPWRVAENAIGTEMILGSISAYRLADICSYEGTLGPTKEISRANARLIAACPVMLDILQTVNAYFYEYRNGELSGYEHELAGQVGALVAMIDGPEE